MGTMITYKGKICKIGKKADKSDCAKKDCDNCRHWIDKEFVIDCMKCKLKVPCSKCPYKSGVQ